MPTSCAHLTPAFWNLPPLRWVFAMLTAVCLATPAPLALADATSSGKNAPVAVSLPWLKDVTEALMCSPRKRPVVSLVPPGDDPHAFAFRPSTRAVLASSALVVSVDTSTLEQWLGRWKPSPDQQVLNLAAAIPETARDPHIWHSPTLVLAASRSIQKALNTLEPGLSPDTCLKAWEGIVDSTVQQLKSRLKGRKTPVRFASNHDALGHMALTYGFEIIPILGISHEQKPTPQQFKKTLDSLKQKNIRVIFLDGESSPDMAKSLSREAGISLGGSLYTDNLGTPNSPAGSLLGMWNANMDIILKACVDAP